MPDNASYVGSTQAYSDGQGNGMNPNGDDASPSMFHAWLIVVGSLVLLWILGGIVFRTVRI